MDIKTLRRRIGETLRRRIGEFLFFLGKKPCYSTGICGNMTCGYGQLGSYGYWQYPVPSKERALKKEFQTDLKKAEAEYKQTIMEKGALD